MARETEEQELARLEREEAEMLAKLSPFARGLFTSSVEPHLAVPGSSSFGRRSPPERKLELATRV